MSTTSILIFSIFLIGVAIGRGTGEGLSPYVLSAGLGGTLAFVALDLARTRRREQDLRHECNLIAARLERHLSQCQSADTEHEPAHV